MLASFVCRRFVRFTVLQLRSVYVLWRLGSCRFVFIDPIGVLLFAAPLVLRLSAVSPNLLVG